jgi:hypothetical protein
MSKLTRRELAATLSASTVLLAQPAANAPPEELKSVRDQMRDIADTLDKFPLPLDVEPATTFKP